MDYRITDKELERVVTIIADIRNEDRKDRPRRHRVTNLADQIYLIIRKTQRRGNL